MSLRVSVVVPVLDMAQTLGSCLQALQAQSYPRELTEVLVVDNGSRDGTLAVARRFAVTGLEENRPGAPSARNLGIQHASGDIIAFTDADCVPTRGWIAGLVQAMDEERVVVGAGPLAPLDPDRSAVAAYSARIGQYDPARTLSHPVYPYAATGNVAFRREVFETVGPFNPEFRTFDSAELFWRMKRSGILSSVLAPRAVVFYRSRDSVAAFARQNYGYGQGYARLCHATGRGDVLTIGRTVSDWWRHLPDGVRVAFGGGQRGLRRQLSVAGLHLVRETALALGRVSIR